MTLAAVIGSDSLFLLYAWLVSAAVSAYLSDRKGYGEKPGLATGLLLFVIGPVIWLLWPVRAGSKWATAGMLGRRGRRDRQDVKRRH